MKRYEILNYPHFADVRGDLVPFEFCEKFPFLVKRAYLVTAHAGQRRGGHAHIQEEEMFVAVSGSLRAVVNDGTGDKRIVLDRKNKALLVRTNCWHEFLDFSPEAVMLCFSSTRYIPGEDNYIMDKTAFLKKMQK